VRARAIHRLAILLGVLAPGPFVAGAESAAAPDPLQAATGATAAPPNVADMDLAELVNVRVSPFDVSTRLDLGYRASNSVSASRFDAPIRDLPFAVQAFTESFIADQKPRDLFDVARYSPGVTYRSNDFNEGNANLAIRGFTVSTYPAGIQVLRDGYPGPPILDFTNVSRVEVVKGPSSFLYGQVAPGGIVNVITKRPRPELAATVEATTGSYGQHRFEGDVNAPLARTLSARVAGSWDQDIGYWKPYDAHSWDVAPALRWEPDRRVAVSASYERFRKLETPQVMQKPGYNTQSGPVPTPSDPNRSGVDVPGLPDTWNSMAYSDYRRSDTSTVSTWVDVAAGDHWNLRAGYSHLDSEIDMLFTGNLGMANNATLLQGRRVKRQTYWHAMDTCDANAVGTYALGGVSLRVLLGGQFIDRRFDAKAGQVPNNPAYGTDPTGSPLPLWNLGDPSTWDRNTGFDPSLFTAGLARYTVWYRDVSGYGGTTLGFLDDRLLLLGGARLTSTRNRKTDHVASTQEEALKADVVTPQYGALYKLTPGLSLFASYAESFVPGVQTLGQADGTQVPAVPTRGQGYDAGVKADLFGGRVSGTITFFDLRNRHVVTDLATTDTNGIVTIVGVQAGEQVSRGVEVDATITATPQWQIYASYSYMHARITEFTGNDRALLAQDPSTLGTVDRANYKNAKRFHNAPLQMSAPHLANLWTKYAIAHGPLAGLYVGGGVNFVYEQTILPDTPASERQTYALVNAMAGYSRTWRPVRFSLDLTGKNLRGERYRPSQSTRARPTELLLTLTARY
jgi:iron complex outermembrane receptor protein